MKPCPHNTLQVRKKLQIQVFSWEMLSQYAYKKQQNSLRETVIGKRQIHKEWVFPTSNQQAVPTLGEHLTLFPRWHGTGLLLSGSLPETAVYDPQMCNANKSQDGASEPMRALAAREVLYSQGALQCREELCRGEAFSVGTNSFSARRSRHAEEALLIPFY